MLSRQGSRARGPQALDSRVLCVSFLGPASQVHNEASPKASLCPPALSCPHSVWSLFRLPRFLCAVLAKAELESPNEILIQKRLFLGYRRWPL